MPRFELTTAIHAAPERVFDASLDVDVHTASMAKSNETVISGVTTGRMALGETVTWSARHFGIPWRMTSTITTYDPPTSFTDEQSSGPFRRWRHDHIFELDDHGGTVMHDIIDYRAPFGPLGSIAESLVLNAYLNKLIRERNKHIKSLFEN